MCTRARAAHYLKREGLDGGVYVRVGSNNRRADRELVEELCRFARGEAFDEQPMPGLHSEARDFGAASESFAPVASAPAENWRPCASSQAARARYRRDVELIGHD
jgi:predicted HTH transcriptional regulator